MPEPFVAAAVDHVTAFEDAGSVLVAAYGAATVKLRLARALSAAVDAVMVDPLTLRTWREDKEFPLVARKLWLGDIDYELDGGGDALQARKALTLASQSGIAGIKFGVHCEHEPERASEFISVYVSAATLNGLGVMPEPYFGDLEEDQRMTVLASGRGAVAMKCDVDDPARWAAPYSNGTGGRWVARSDGASFEAFLDRATLAMKHGCAGVVAGRALWCQPLREALTIDGLVEVVCDRVKYLRALSPVAAPP